MERMMRRTRSPLYGRNIEPDATGKWANSPVLFLLTCYDVWSATPPRGCEPAVADPAEATPPAM